jgi:hypothetical protein
MSPGSKNIEVFIYYKEFTTVAKNFLRDLI